MNEIKENILNLNEDNNEILKQLSKRQREAAEYIDGHLLVLAGAGSGKTRVLTHKIAWLVAEKIAKPNEILAVTFTNKAAGEMKERIKNLTGDDYKKIWIGTFHGYGLNFLFRHKEEIYKIAGLREGFTIFDRKDSLALLKNIMKEFKSPESLTPASMMDLISRDRMLWSPFPHEGLLNDYGFAISKKYRNELRERNAVDFDDLIILPLEIMESDKHVKEREQNKFKWVLVDEYQDVNIPQYWLLKRFLVGDKTILNVVGDPDQSIYRWRGAEIKMILNFEKEFYNAKTIILDENYRSTKNILEASNYLIRNNTERLKKDLYTVRASGEKIYNLLARSDFQEVDFIATEIEKLCSIMGYKYSDIAILYRQNSMSRIIEKKLIEEKIPYKIIRGLAFYDRMEVRDVLAILRFALNPSDRAAFERVSDFAIKGMGAKRQADFENWIDSPEQKELLNEPGKIWSLIAGGAWQVKGEAGKSMQIFAGHACQILEMSDKGIINAIDYVLKDLGYEEYLKTTQPENFGERINNVQELKSVVPEGNLIETLAEATLYTDADINEENEEDAINLMTLHAAKGLEFPVVFIIGLEEGIFPHNNSKTDPEDLEEERRLCYVGMTRAEERLYLTAAKTRRLYGTVVENDFSRFLYEIPDGLKRVDDRGTRSSIFNSYSHERSRSGFSSDRKNFNSHRNHWGRK